jgi:hypothetical protein
MDANPYDRNPRNSCLLDYFMRVIFIADSRPETRPRILAPRPKSTSRVVHGTSATYNRSRY